MTTTALLAAEQHLAELAANRVAAKDKPSAFHHGLIQSLVSELATANARLAAERKARANDQREFQREARDIAAEARQQERHGGEYGSY